MADRPNETDETLDGIEFIGNALGPLFYYDPKDDAARSSYAAFSALDPKAASQEWPYASHEDAYKALSEMVEGMKDGIDDDLVWEYRRLFVGPAAKAAPPWGSVYTDRECVIFGESTLELRQWMRHVGIDRLVEDNEPEDHIGLMLMLLSWIATNRPDLTDEYLKSHLLTWAGHFLEIMESEAKHPFYVGLARLTSSSLEGIRDERGIEVEYPRYYR